MPPSTKSWTVTESFRPIQPRMLLGWCVLAAVLGSGCRYNDPSIDLLESELRWMEDQLYEMEDQLEQTCVDLSRCKRDRERDITTNKQKARVQSGSSGLDPVADPALQIQAIGGNERPPSHVILPDGTVCPDNGQTFAGDALQIDSYSDSSLDPTPEFGGFAAPDENYDLPSDLTAESSPVILSQDDPNPVSSLPDEHELPAPVSTHSDLQPTPAGDRPKLEVPERPKFDSPKPGTRPSLESDVGPDDQALLLVPPSPEEQYSIRLQSHVTSEPIPPELEAATKKRNVDAHITHIVVQARRTARGTDGLGHDLEVLVQPRNADGNYVSLPANVSVVVIDDELTGDAARIARWDLEATETSRRFRKTDRGDGIHLEFDWPSGPPLGEKLHLYVRYVTVDGRKVQTRKFLEPLGKSKASDDGGWSVIGRAKPISEWRVVSQQKLTPVPTASASKAPSKLDAQPKPSVVRPIAVTESTGDRKGQSKATTVVTSWAVAPTNDAEEAPAVPGRMPSVRTEPIQASSKTDEKATPSSQFSRIPASVPQWSPQR